MAERSLADICMDAIAERAGVGKGTLYRRFPERASLYMALLDEDARALQEQVIAGFGLPVMTSPRIFALRLLTELFDFVFRNREILSSAASSHRAGPQRYDHPGHAWQRQSLMAFLRAATRKGELAASDLEATAELLLAGLHPDLLEWLLSDSRTVEQLRTHYREA